MNNTLKELLNEFLQLFGNCLCIVSLMLGSFLILINLYHSRETNNILNSFFAEQETYTNFKKKVDELDKKVKSVNVNVADSNKRMYLQSVQTTFFECFNTIKETKYYNIKENKISAKDIYDFNENMMSSVQKDCLFSINYTIKNSLEQYRVDLNYDIYDQIQKNRISLAYYENNLKEQLLNNSSYYYTSDITRTGIYNQLANNLSLVINNYNQVIDNVELMANWYIGGAK